MKLRNKVIVLPTLIMLVIFIVGMLSIEFYLKTELTKNLRDRLHTLSSFSLTAIDLINNQETQELNPKFDQLANQIGQINDIRVSFFDQHGKMLGDSELSFEEVKAIESHHNRPEIIQAIKQNASSSIRYSNTLKQNMAYFTAYDNNSGYLARIAINSNIYHNTIINLRWRFSFIIFATIIAMIIFGFLTLQLINKAVNKERQQQEQHVSERTREITLIQAMTTMLNGLDSINDAERIISSILPKLLPNYSGAIFLKNEDERKLQQLVHWGKAWPDDVSVIANWRQKITANIDVVSSNDIHIINNIVYAGLKANNIDLGVIYLISPRSNINKKEQHLLENLTHQISFAFANLSIKNQLQNQAIRDPLTNLYNRRFMFEAFGQALNKAERHKSPLALLMIDVDDFKLFNDKYGHSAGDHVLVKTAEILQTKLRLEDIACRFGGEEFCIICPETNLQDAYLLAEKIRHYISELRVSYAAKTLGAITISTGIAIYPNHGTDANMLLKSADQALYVAKGKGRNITEVANANTKHAKDIQFNL